MNKSQREYAICKAQRELHKHRKTYLSEPSVRAWLKTNPAWAKLKSKEDLQRLATNDSFDYLTYESLLQTPKAIQTIRDKNKAIELVNDKINNQIDTKIEELEDFLYLGNETEALELINSFKSWKPEIN